MGSIDVSIDGSGEESTMKPWMLALALVGVGVLMLIIPNKGTVPSQPTFKKPSQELQQEVSEIKAFRGKKNSDKAAAFYSDFADVVSRNKSIIQTTSQLRAAHQRAQALFAERTGMEKSDLSPEIDKVLLKEIGKEDIPFNRQRVVDIFNAIAWALGGSD